MALSLSIEKINDVNYKVFDVDGAGTNTGDIIVVEIENPKGSGTYVPFIDQYTLANIEWLDSFSDWENKTLPTTHPNYNLLSASFPEFSDRMTGIQFPNGSFGTTVLGDFVVDYDAFAKASEKFTVVRGGAGYIAAKFKELDETIAGL